MNSQPRDLFGSAAEEPCTVPVTEAARRLGVSRPTVYNAIKRKQLPVIRVGNRQLIPRAQFEIFLRGEQ